MMMYRVLAVMVTALFFVACGGGSTPEGEPYVISDSFGDGSGVSISSDIRVQFNKDIDEKKNDEANIALYAEGNTTAIDGTATISGDTLTFDPDIILEYSSSYTLIVDDVVDLTNTEMKSAYRRNFTTTDFVSAVDPENGENNVSVFADVTLTFGETIDPASLAVSVSNLTFTTTSSDNRIFTLTPNGGTAYDTFYSGLDAATTFTVTVSAATDSNGKVLPAPFTASFTTVPPDVTAPAVISAYPQDGASDIPSDINISLQFDEDLLALTAANFTLTDENANTIAYTLDYDDTTRTATLLPAGTLGYATAHTLTLSNIQDIFGNALNTTLSFTTSTILKATTPDDGDDEVEVDTVLTAVFEGQIDASGATFTLEESGGAAVAGSTSFGTSLATFTPSADLDFSTTYTATISGVKDLSGNTLADESWSFSTQLDDINPELVSTTPANGATGIATGSTVSATFNENIDGTIKFIVQDSDGISVSGNIAISGATVTFTPDSALEAAESYSVFVSGVTDLSGNKAQTLIWSFETL